MRRCALLFALGLSACGPKLPEGQVVARVDWVEITRRDVLLELLAEGAPPDVDVARAQPALLDAIVARKLLVLEAERLGLDKSPEYLGEVRRTRELILTEQLERRLAGRQPPPTPRAIAAYLAANRKWFEQRRIIRLDRIVAATAPSDDASPAVARSNDAVAQWLSAKGLTFDRTVVTIDTRDGPVGPSTALDRAMIGRPTIKRMGSGLVSEAVLDVVDLPFPPEEQRRTAEAVLRADATRDAIQRTVHRLQMEATVTFQPGFGPASTKGTQPTPSD